MSASTAIGMLWKWFELRKQANPYDPARAIPGIEQGIEATIRKDLVDDFERVLRAAEKQVRAHASVS